MGDENKRTKIQWERPKVVAGGGKASNMPSPRSGHSFTIVGTNGFMFGGLGFGKPAAPNNDVFMLKIGREMEWVQIRLDAAESPVSRWRHSAVLVENTQVLVFGGFHSATARLNDVWIFNTVTVDWWQPRAGTGPGFTPRGNHPPPSWPNSPAPRGGHSATLIGRQVFIFGGYGGFGYVAEHAHTHTHTHTHTHKEHRRRAARPRPRASVAVVAAVVGGRGGDAGGGGVWVARGWGD